MRELCKILVRERACEDNEKRLQKSARLTVKGTVTGPELVIKREVRERI
jgi:hypothetical protein